MELERKQSIHFPNLDEAYAATSVVHLYSRWGLWDMIRILAEKHPEKLRLWSVDCLFEICCHSGNVEVAKWLYATKPSNQNIHAENSLYYAIMGGKLDIIQWIISWISPQDMDSIKSHRTYSKLVANATISGNLDVLKYVFMWNENHSTYRNSAFYHACVDGHLHIAQWIYETYTMINVEYNDNHGIYEACRNGHFHVVEWLFTIHSAFNTQEMKNTLLYIACDANSFEIAQWLMKNGAKIEYLHVDNAFHRACISGSPRIILWIHEQNPQRYQYRVEKAYDHHYDYEYTLYYSNIQYSLVERQQKILKGRISIHLNHQNNDVYYFMSNMAKYGLLGMLEYYHALYFRTFIAESSMMIYHAATHGHMDVIHYIYSITQNVDLSVYNHGGFITACKSGYIQIAEWYRSVMPQRYNFRMDNDEIIPVIRKDYPMRRACPATCAICFEDCANVITRCGHYYCDGCIEEWMKIRPTCPYCTQSLKSSSSCDDPPLFYIEPV